MAVKTPPAAANIANFTFHGGVNRPTAKAAAALARAVEENAKAIQALAVALKGPDATARVTS